jgi:hypothetical protein
LGAKNVGEFRRFLDFALTTGRALAVLAHALRLLPDAADWGRRDHSSNGKLLFNQGRTS